jgi:hypothetical protein
VVANNFNSTPVKLATLTVNRTGYWAASAWVKRQNGPASNSNLYLSIRYNAVQQSAQTYWMDSTTNAVGGGVHVDPTLITNGQLIDFYAQSDLGGNTTGNPMELKAWFVPTPAYPH